ncbi:hypothetical protein K505DRAFT_352637 [Melanomma pulvis-pyrius CBS 109.77]|uniref:Mid2 domain-containing protein n=1 Tax=Melanomma pulvis-pyrius CBS 109.77 TaxID=1314802 RepID=A0A6A6WZK6_9PLEO|nr:hypothetical protein K505DRAFT_352637 [Melanomma pulvis-pyrius CBS 109.77]
MYLSAALVTVVALSASTLAQTCYFPNGAVSPDDIACTNGKVSACCYKKGQACLSNGLCVSDPHDPSLAAYHRGTCTDKSWKIGGGCPNHCTGGKLGKNDNGVNVYSCNHTNPNSFCCGDNCDCASNFETFSFPDEISTITIIGEAFTASSTIASSTSTSTAAATTSVPAASASTSPPAVAEETPKKKSNSAAIGAGVAIPLVLLALAGVAFFFWRRKKAKRNAGAAYAGDGTSSYPVEVANNEYYPPQQSQKYAQNIQGDVKHAYTSATPQDNSMAAELPATNFAPVELPAETAAKK